MSFEVGDEVVVLALNRRGRVTAREHDRYRVVVGAMTVACREQELRPSNRKTPSRKDLSGSLPRADDEGRREIRTLDLHGMSVEQARDALLAFLNGALLDGLGEIHVLHGIGTGRIKRAVREQLRAIDAVKHVRAHPTNPGITIVQL
jgi:DNA mismatch repair protein MutS2